MRPTGEATKKLTATVNAEALKERGEVDVDKNWQLFWINVPDATSKDGTPSAVMLADLDKDGYTDILLARGAPHTVGTFSVLFGPHPNGEASSGNLTWQSSTLQVYSRMAVGDLNNDNCLDVVVGRLSRPDGYKGGVDVFWGQPLPGASMCMREFKITSIIEDVKDVGVLDAALADFNHDGFLDIAAARGKEGDSGKYGFAIAPRIYTNNMEREDNDPEFSTWWEAEQGVAAAFSILADDLFGGSELDLMVGGRGYVAHASHEPNPGDNPVPAWAVRFADPNPNKKDSVTYDYLNGHGSFMDYPSLYDMAQLPRLEGNTPRIAAGFSAHHCVESAKACQKNCDELYNLNVFKLLNVTGGEFSGSPLATCDFWNTVATAPSSDERATELMAVSRGFESGSILLINGISDNSAVPAGVTDGDIGFTEIVKSGIAQSTLAIGDMKAKKYREYCYENRNEQCLFNVHLPAPLADIPRVSSGDDRNESRDFSAALGNTYISLKECLEPEEKLCVEYMVPENVSIVFAQKEASKGQSQVGLLMPK